ncbi:SLC13 family permease [Noviherbaspirillum sp. UKPF54]|uniref:SLC13 family permease n=1 Tax=Noviherbaspirillum sp. UKPF54 TaxID=2601898 RepID=UPI0011B157F3|nr:SLC13 family permease [Noviherbaspirillum sp. UKPF54]QDZ27171.1 SLC13 family permease [Noviherbaspirillum sp. UKPF54]
MHTPEAQQIIFFLIAAAALGLLVTEWLRVDIVAVLIILALAISGILKPQDAFSGLSSEPAVIVAAIFVLSRALQLSGLSDMVAGWIVRAAGKRESRVLAVMMLGVSAFATFTEHVTPTAIMMPALLKLSRERGIPASKLLMPLSFAASLGSTIALIGAPAFLFSSTLLQQAGRPGLSLFSITPVGLALAILGVLYVLLIGRFLLPANKGRGSGSDLFQTGRYLAELTVLPDSALVGAHLEQLRGAGLSSFELIKWLRNGESLRRPFGKQVLEPGDTLLIHLTSDELATLRQEPDGLKLKPVEQFDRPGAQSEGPGEELSAHMVQAVVMPRSQLVGATIRELGLQRKYGVVALAVSREGTPASEEIDRVRLRVGDVLVLEGDEAEIQELTRDQPGLMLAPFPGQPRPRKARVAAAIMAATIGLASASLLPLPVVLVAGALAMVLFGCVTVNQAYQAIDTRIFVFIAGAIPLGLAMQKTGAAERIAHLLQGVMGGWPPMATLFALFAVAALVTQVLSDAGTLSIFGPVAIALAHALGRPPEPYVLAIAFAAVTGFVTPIAHWGNLLVFGPGNYRFSDFVKVGTPLTVLIGLVVAWLTPIVFA